MSGEWKIVKGRKISYWPRSLHLSEQKEIALVVFYQAEGWPVKDLEWTKIDNKYEISYVRQNRRTKAWDIKVSFTAYAT